MINFDFRVFKTDIPLSTDILKKWITATISEESKYVGNINYEFLTDEELYKMNLQYLNHDTYTDIITFNNSISVEIITADIFISIDRIKENSENIQESFLIELLRVIIHGILHLCGYDDKSEEEKNLMRTKENYYLQKYPEDVSRETK